MSSPPPRVGSVSASSLPEGGGVGDFGPGDVLRAASGTSGTASATWRLNNHGDYVVQFTINGTGSILIDDIRITDPSGLLVASENAEGPSLAPGPLSFQVTDAIALLTSPQASAVSAAAEDLDGDGYPEVILTLVTPRPSTTPLALIVIEASGRMSSQPPASSLPGHRPSRIRR